MNLETAFAVRLIRLDPPRKGRHREMNGESPFSRACQAAAKIPGVNPEELFWMPTTERALASVCRYGCPWLFDIGTEFGSRLADPAVCEDITQLYRDAYHQLRDEARVARESLTDATPRDTAESLIRLADEHSDEFRRSVHAQFMVRAMRMLGGHLSVLLRPEADMFLFIAAATLGIPPARVVRVVDHPTLSAFEREASGHAVYAGFDPARIQDICCGFPAWGELHAQGRHVIALPEADPLSSLAIVVHLPSPP